MNNIKLDEFSLNEEKLCEIILKLSDESINSRIRETLKNNSYIFIFYSVCKYLIHIKGYNPIDVVDMIRKYAAIIVYKYIVDTENIQKLTNYDEYRIKAFDEIIKRNINEEDLKNNIEFESTKLSDLIKYYNGDNCYLSIISIEKILKKLDNYSTDLSKNVMSILNCDFRFFSHQCRIEMYDGHDKIRRFDMIVAEAAIDSQFDSFTFSLSENTLNNIFNDEKKNKLSKGLIKRATIYIGHLIHYAIKDKNLAFKNPLRLISSVHFIFACCEKDVSVNTANLRFVKSVRRGKKYIVEYDENKILHFEFTYNGSKGSMNSKGITIESYDES